MTTVADAVLKALMAVMAGLETQGESDEDKARRRREDRSTGGEECEEEGE